MNKEYMINDELRIYDNGTNEIRLRIGIWNYNEAVIDLSNETEDLKNRLRKLIEKLLKGEVVEVKDIMEEPLSDNDKAALVGLFDGLHETGIFITREEKLKGSALIDILAGEYKELGRPEDREEEGKRKFLFITDDENAAKTIEFLSENMNLNIDRMSQEKIERLKGVDLTTKMDTLTYYAGMKEFEEELEAYYGVIVCLRRAEVSMLRNLNRILIHTKKQGLISFIDGPFITAFGIKPPFTGCIECFEERVLSKMEDHSAYEKFQKFKFQNREGLKANKGHIPLVNFLSNLCVSEAYMLSVLGTNKLQGRCLSMYIPSMEIQIQDLLKVPYCNACGAVEKIRFKDLNINSRRIVDDVLDKISSEDKGLL